MGEGCFLLHGEGARLCSLQILCIHHIMVSMTKLKNSKLPVAVVVLISKDGVPILIQTKNHVVPDTDSDPKLK